MCCTGYIATFSFDLPSYHGIQYNIMMINTGSLYYVCIITEFLMEVLITTYGGASTGSTYLLQHMYSGASTGST